MSEKADARLGNKISQSEGGGFIEYPGLKKEFPRGRKYVFQAARWVARFGFGRVSLDAFAQVTHDALALVHNRWFPSWL